MSATTTSAAAIAPNWNQRGVGSSSSIMSGSWREVSMRKKVPISVTTSQAHRPSYTFVPGLSPLLVLVGDRNQVEPSARFPESELFGDTEARLVLGPAAPDRRAASLADLLDDQ